MQLHYSEAVAPAACEYRWQYSATLINAWEDKKVVDAVRDTGRKQLIIAGLWTEVCVAMPAIQALGEGSARAETAVKLTEVIKQHAGGSGIAYLWEQQLLNTPVPTAAG